MYSKNPNIISFIVSVVLTPKHKGTKECSRIVLTNQALVHEQWMLLTLIHSPASLDGGEFWVTTQKALELSEGCCCGHGTLTFQLCHTCFPSQEQFQLAKELYISANRDLMKMVQAWAVTQLFRQAKFSHFSTVPREGKERGTEGEKKCFENNPSGI